MNTARFIRRALAIIGIVAAVTVSNKRSVAGASELADDVAALRSS